MSSVANEKQIKRPPTLRILCTSSKYFIRFESVLWQDEQSLSSLSSSPLSIKTLKLSSSRSTCKKERKMIFQALAYKLLPSPHIILKYKDLLLEQVADFCHDTLFRKNLLNLIPLAGSITKQDHEVNVIDNFQQHLATLKNTLLFNSSTPTITPVHFLNWKTKISISVDLMTINL